MPWIRSSNVSLNTSRHIQNNFNYNCCYARPFWTTALRRLCFFLITGVKKKKGKKRAPNWASPIWKPTLASSHWGPGKAPGSFTCLHARPKAAISPNFWGLGYGLWLSNWLKIRFLVPRVRKFDTTVCTLHTDFHPLFQRTELIPPRPSFLSFCSVLGFARSLCYRYVFLLLHN